MEYARSSRIDIVRRVANVVDIEDIGAAAAAVDRLGKVLPEACLVVKSNLARRPVLHRPMAPESSEASVINVALRHLVVSDMSPS